MLFKIGELATRAGCLVETVRYYERQQLLPAPSRSAGNYRLYGEAHLEQMQFIRHCRALDMTLEEIRSLLRFKGAPEENCGEVNLLLDKHIGHVANRIEELKRLQIQLNGLRNLCSSAQATKDCGILHALATAEDGLAKNLGTHDGSCH
jgi:Cd(II)/Pb(II)-responsive transcriptional regulator